MMDIIEQSGQEEYWDVFLQYKIERQHLSRKEEAELRAFLDNKTYVEWEERFTAEEYELPLPVRRQINKGGSSKKRVVYSYPYEMNQMLKFIAYALYAYDGIFADNCYAFRRDYGVKDAITRIRRAPQIASRYCLKVDVHNYFNSIDVDLLLDKLAFLQEKDERLYRLFEQLLTVDAALIPVENENGGQRENSESNASSPYQIITEKRGAMAGTPISPFLANVYLRDVDVWFADQQILYFRYSDDILVFADTLEELQQYQKILYDKLAALHLELNPDKVKISAPGEMWEFLGFCYRDGRVDLSENTIRKMKQKIKRKAESLRRWQRKKGLSGEKAAKGFIKAMNYKFFAKEDGTEFTWSRWFFPNLTTDQSLKVIDVYMQQYVRYCVTGRHYKGNYRISYDMMKQWGYRSLVAEYYAYRKQGMQGADVSPKK